MIFCGIELYNLDRMEFPEKLFEVIYQIVIQQNRHLLEEIAVREKIPVHEMYQTFLKHPRKDFKKFMETYTSSSSPSSSSSSSG